MMTASVDNVSSSTTAALRPPRDVMRLEHLGARFPSRISFLRSLLRKMVREQWRVSRDVFDLDADGYGCAAYRVDTPHGTYTLVCFSDPLDPAERSDRVIAEKWDTTFALLMGGVDAGTLKRLRANVPKQEAGRCSPTEIVLCRANKSARLFEYVTQCLARGEQPSLAQIGRVGYLLRTTAVYGSGKFGLADFERVKEQTCFDQPFRHEMLAVYLVREFSLDLVEHIAAQRGGVDATTLRPALRRCFGVGNATGLGMAPYLVGHPKLLHRWLQAYETALARVKNVPTADPALQQRFLALVRRAIAHIRENDTSDTLQQQKNARLLSELGDVLHDCTKKDESILSGSRPWQRVADRADAQLGPDAREMLNALMLELYPELVDELADDMASDELMALDPGMSLADLKQLLERHYAWALEVDFDDADAQHLFWYRSEEKLEPRLGRRHAEPGAEIEMPVCTAHRVWQLHWHLAGLDSRQLQHTVVDLLMEQPGWRGIVRRVQSLADSPYAEIRDNLLDMNTLAIDMLRCKLSFMGAGKYDPKSDRWVRTNFFQGAPLTGELGPDNVDDWALPCLAELAGER